MNARAVLCAGLAGAAAAAIAGSRALFVAALAATILGELAVYARAHLFDGVSYGRTVSRRVAPWGAEVEMTTVVENPKWLPLVWLKIADRWPPGVEALDTRVRPVFQGAAMLDRTLFLRWYERVRRRYRCRCLERGLHSFGPATMEASDPFGLGGLEKEVEEQTTLLVLPRVLAVPAIDLVVGRPLPEAPAMRSLARDPLGFAGLRPYVPGDPLHAVNWRATARTGALQANELESAVAAQVRILLNVQAFEFAWEGIALETIELLCVTAASLAAALDEAGLAVGLLSNALLARLPGQAAVEPGTGTLPEILDALARVVASPPPPFASVLRQEVEDACGTWGETEYLVVTPALFGDVPALLRELAARNPVRVVFVGEPPPEHAGLVDARVPGDFEWRTSGALALG